MGVLYIYCNYFGFMLSVSVVNVLYSTVLYIQIFEYTLLCTIQYDGVILRFSAIYKLGTWPRKRSAWMHNKVFLITGTLTIYMF